MASEKRLIYLDDLLKFPIRITHYDMVNGNRHFVLGIESVLEYAENLPTVDVEEAVHGEWGEIYTCHGERLWGYKCSRCEQDSAKKSNYCPNCGAKMDGDGNG